MNQPKHTAAAWIDDDGGRAVAGFRGTCGDCVVRLIAIATEVPYSSRGKQRTSGGAVAKVQPKLHTASFQTSGLDWPPILEWTLSDVLEYLQVKNFP